MKKYRVKNLRMKRNVISNDFWFIESRNVKMEQSKNITVFERLRQISICKTCFCVNCIFVSYNERNPFTFSKQTFYTTISSARGFKATSVMREHHASNRCSWIFKYLQSSESCCASCFAVYFKIIFIDFSLKLKHTIDYAHYVPLSNSNQQINSSPFMRLSV